MELKFVKESRTSEKKFCLELKEKNVSIRKQLFLVFLHFFFTSLFHTTKMFTLSRFIKDSFLISKSEGFSWSHSKSVKYNVCPGRKYFSNTVLPYISIYPILDIRISVRQSVLSDAQGTPPRF